jgi:ABC-type glycerol-3-phosphate transport system substrate-binding protein
VGALEGGQLKEATYVTPGNGNLGVLANPPHPNAVKVYLNYLLSAEGQLAWSRATGFPSLRRDIPADHVLPVYVLKDGVPYMDAYSDSYAPKAAEVTAFMETVLRR